MTGERWYRLQGLSLAAALLASVVAGGTLGVERNVERVRAASEVGILAVEADASREEALKRVRIDQARGLIAAVGTDAENVYAVLTARVLRPDLFIVELATSSDNLELAMEEVTIASNTSLANQSILTANLRQRFGVIVVGIQRQDGRMEFNPEPDTSIQSGDKLVVLGRPEPLKGLEAEAQG